MRAVPCNVVGTSRLPGASMRSWQRRTHSARLCWSLTLPQSVKPWVTTGRAYDEKYEGLRTYHGMQTVACGLQDDMPAASGCRHRHSGGKHFSNQVQGENVSRCIIGQCGLSLPSLSYTNSKLVGRLTTPVAGPYSRKLHISGTSRCCHKSNEVIGFL